MVGDDELCGHFEAAFGTQTDQFSGCFHVDVVSADAEPQQCPRGRRGPPG